MSPDLQARINAALAKPYTHKVISHYDNGTTRIHEARGQKEAENFAIGARRNIGRTLIGRETDLPVKVVAVTIEATSE